MLACVYFSNRKDAFIFYQIFFDCARHDLKGDIKEDKNKWYVVVQENGRSLLSEMGQAIIEILNKRKLNAWMEGVLRHRFYYDDPDEIDRVIRLSVKIKKDPPEGVQLPNIEKEMERFVKRKVFERSYSDFDELSASCLKYIYSELLDFTGKLLDEYKLEEAHQMMVDSWRRRVKNKVSGVPLLHVTYDKGLKYYFPEGNPVGRAELINYLDSHPDPMIQNLPEDPGILPALIYSPEELMIYADEQGEAKLELLMNIFEEKAVWKPLSFFPFLKA
ncbi:putative sporulation protein YtxC [Halobacillus sp. A5]|uniref:putative sporulation protein YtxC n=1 Tax=Halobacillus sp. A5 TaxID=2880263 RepID=UPI0020A6B14D|nr:putative sporulation protein YtxC [Halobacillus sp. A5]MCP3025476.1 putative sporulation protein YtxC [Halobacillus sp. A5]